MVQAVVSRQDWGRTQHYHLALGPYGMSPQPLQYSGEDSLPAEDCRMPGAIRVSVPMGWDGGY